MSSQYFSTASVAKRWGCSPDFVRKLVREGAIRAIALSAGKRTSYRISLQAIEQYESRMTKGKTLSRPEISAGAIAFSQSSKRI